MMNQQAGEKRANQVREELISKIDSLDRRVTESRDDLKERLIELKHDLKESIASEVGHLKSEILNALPPRARSASEEHRS